MLSYFSVFNGSNSLIGPEGHCGWSLCHEMTLTQVAAQVEDQVRARDTAEGKDKQCGKGFGVGRWCEIRKWGCGALQISLVMLVSLQVSCCLKKPVKLMNNREATQKNYKCGYNRTLKH